MTIGRIDEKRIEEAIRRLSVLPERKAEIGRAETGLLYVIRRAVATGSGSSDAEAKAEAPPAVDAAHLAAAKELRDAQWAFYDFREAWTALSEIARDAFKRTVRSRGLSRTDLDASIERLTQAAELLSAAAGDLEEPERPKPPPRPDDPLLVIAQHTARMYTRLTGKHPPKAKPNGDYPRGPFYWLLEDVLAASGVIASAGHYARMIVDD